MQEDSLNAAKEGKAAKSGEIGRYALYLAAVLLIAAFLIYSSNKWADSQPIKNISVQGNSMISDDEVTGRLRTPVINSSRDKIKLEEIYEEIIDNPFVSSSFVMHSNTGEISIEIREKEPLAILVTEKGDLSFVDGFGSVMPYRVLQETKDLPIISNVSSRDGTDTMALKDALLIVRKLLESDNAMLYLTTSEIVYNPVDKSYTLVAADLGFDIILGRTDNLEEKLENLLSFRKNVMPYESPDKIRYIDLRWNNQVLVGKS